MIPSNNKVTKDLFGVVFAKGRTFPFPFFNGRVFFDKNFVPVRFSVVIAKKLEKSAVKRNVMKRRVYSVLQPYLKTSKPGLVCVLFVKKKVLSKDIENVTKEIKEFLKKVNLA